MYLRSTGEQCAPGPVWGGPQGRKWGHQSALGWPHSVLWVHHCHLHSVENKEVGWVPFFPLCGRVPKDLKFEVRLQFRKVAATASSSSASPSCWRSACSPKKPHIPKQCPKSPACSSVPRSRHWTWLMVVDTGTGSAQTPVSPHPGRLLWHADALYVQWLALGSAAGLHTTAAQDRARSPSPSPTFTAEALQRPVAELRGAVSFLYPDTFK